MAVASCIFAFSTKKGKLSIFIGVTKIHFFPLRIEQTRSLESKIIGQNGYFVIFPWKQNWRKTFNPKKLGVRCDQQQMKTTQRTIEINALNSAKVEKNVFNHIAEWEYRMLRDIWVAFVACEPSLHAHLWIITKRLNNSVCDVDKGCQPSSQRRFAGVHARVCKRNAKVPWAWLHHRVEAIAMQMYSR